MHAEEKTSKCDETEDVGRVVMDKDVYEVVSVNEELLVEDAVAKDVEDEQLHA